MNYPHLEKLMRQLANFQMTFHCDWQFNEFINKHKDLKNELENQVWNIVEDIMYISPSETDNTKIAYLNFNNIIKYNLLKVKLGSVIEGTYICVWINFTELFDPEKYNQYESFDHLLDIKIEDRYNKDYRIHAKPGKVLKKLCPTLSDSEIEKYAHKYRAHVDPKYKFKIVEGKDIALYYNYAKYADESGELGGSCMRNVPSEYFDLYVENTQVKLALIVNEYDKVAARALIWDNKYYDRIYFSTRGTRELLEEYLENMNLKNIWRGRTTLGTECEDQITIKLDKTKFSSYPFVDSLFLLNTETNEIGNYLDFNPDRCLGSTEGDFSTFNSRPCYHINNNSDLRDYFGANVCDCCGDNSDYDLISTREGAQVCEECVRYCDYTDVATTQDYLERTYSGQYCHGDFTVTLHDGECAYRNDSDIEYFEGGYYHSEELGVSEVDENTYLLEDLDNYMVGDINYFCTYEQFQELQRTWEEEEEANEIEIASSEDRES